MSSEPRMGRPPGAKGLPFLGSMLDFGRDPLAFLTRAHSEYGDTSFFTLGHYPMYIFSDPEDIESVLIKQAKFLHKDAIYAFLRPLLGQGLVTSEDDLWKRQRRLIAPAFSPRHIQAYAQVMVDISERIATRMADGEARDIHHDMMELTLYVVLETLFGTASGVDAEVVGEAIEAYMAGFMHDAQGVGRLIPRWVPTPTRRKVARYVDALDNELMPIIRRRRESGEHGDDLLGRLLAAQDDDGAGMSAEQLRDEAITLFVAGHETTALALTYALVRLSENPQARDRLEAEVDDVLGDRPASFDDLSRLPYTRAVIDESMRLDPPVWAIGREATEDIEIGGWHIPQGSQILISPWINHHDARWFEDPWSFKPERWLDGLEKRLPRFAYLPFGGGPRVCVGSHFAIMEAVLALATVARHVALEWDGAPMARVASVTLRPSHPVMATVRRRRHAKAAEEAVAV